ncbi:MAG: hypothetical protein ACLT2F_09025 [Butyricicoccus sp.]
MGRDGYSSIGQGALTVLSFKSEDRREVFEEAAGITKFRYRKEEAERRLSATEENLVRIRDLYGELENRLEPLEQQAGKAKRFLHLRDELRVLEVSLWLLSLEQLKNDTAKLNKDRTTCEKQLADAKQQQERCMRSLSSWPSHCAKLTGKPNVCGTSCAKPSSLPPSRSAVRRLFRRTSATARRISSAHGRRAHTAPSRCRAWMRSLPNGASVFLC